MKNIDLQLYEKNNEVGGTWLENRFGLSRILGGPFVDLHDTDTPAAPVIFHHIVINILGRPIQTGTNC
jgi:cation diffusion facilitator CzcD-associated flavoprotein CzcO